MNPEQDWMELGIDQPLELKPISKEAWERHRQLTVLIEQLEVADRMLYHPLEEDRAKPLYAERAALAERLLKEGVYNDIEHGRKLVMPDGRYVDPGPNAHFQESK